MAMCWHATGRDTSLGRETVKYTRALPPAHYSLKIESFDVLSTLDEEYESDVFEAGGYRWRLCLYPNGNKDDNGSGYISLYLSMDEPRLRPNHKVDVNYKLFVKSRDEYLTIQDADGAISSFQGSNARCGFPRFLSLKKFKNPSNGYLEKDSCTFGAEVFVIQTAKMRQDSFTLTRYPPQSTFTLKIERWSESGADHRSTEFKFQGRQWKLLVYPQGNEAGNGKSLSVYLEVQGLTKKMKVYVDFNLRVVDQLKSKHKEKQFKCWLSASHRRGGDANFMPLKDLQKKSAKGLVNNDTLIVQVQINVISN